MVVPIEQPNHHVAHGLHAPQQTVDPSYVFHYRAIVFDAVPVTRRFRLLLPQDDGLLGLSDNLQLFIIALPYPAIVHVPACRLLTPSEPTAQPVREPARVL